MNEENPVEAVIEDIEDIFQPRPGGLIDRHRRERARREAAEAEQRQENEHIEEPSWKTVKVAQVQPEVTRVNTVQVPAGGTAMVLPLSKYRYRATIIASGVCLLAADAGQALGGTGFPIPANTPLVITSRAQLWAYNFTGAAIPVTSIVELYGPECY